MRNLGQSDPNIYIMGGKENEVDYNHGKFFSPPMICPNNIFNVDNHACFYLEENQVISNFNEKSSFYLCEINFGDEIEKNEN